jgi:hypothetical protein
MRSRTGLYPSILALMLCAPLVCAQVAEFVTVDQARLHLTVVAARNARSNHGGEVYATSCDWDEETLT